MIYSIEPISEQYIEAFNQAVDSVAREQKYLAFLKGPSMAMTREFVMTNVRDGWPHFIALSEDKLVAWCDITSLNREAMAHTGCLGIGVLSGFRSQGIGKQLIEIALNAAKEKGLLRVELTVRENNTRAISLYKKMGFIVEGLHHKAIKIGDTFENHISMALLFDEC